MPEFSNREMGVYSRKLTPKLTPDPTLIRRPKGSKKFGKKSVNVDGQRDLPESDFRNA